MFRMHVCISAPGMRRPTSATQGKLFIYSYLQKIEEEKIFRCFLKESRPPKKAFYFWTLSKRKKGGPTQIQKFYCSFFGVLCALQGVASHAWISLKGMVLLFPGAGAEAKYIIIIYFSVVLYCMMWWRLSLWPLTIMASPATEIDNSHHRDR